VLSGGVLNKLAVLLEFFEVAVGYFGRQSFGFGFSLWEELEAGFAVVNGIRRDDCKVKLLVERLGGLCPLGESELSNDDFAGRLLGEYFIPLCLVLLGRQRAHFYIDSFNLLAIVFPLSISSPLSNDSCCFWSFPGTSILDLLFEFVVELIF
jgi:hypothetical protein